MKIFLKLSTCEQYHKARQEADKDPVNIGSDHTNDTGTEDPVPPEGVSSFT